MRRLLLLLSSAVALVALGTTPAQAITGHFTPDFEHEYVGPVLFYDAEGTPSHRCSGSLLTDRVVLTAGHCVTLDDEGTLDTYGTGIDATVDLSGYGVQNASKNHVVAARERLMAETFILGGRNPQFKDVFNVQLASNPGGGRGGTCFGDSGGRVLLGGTDVIVAVNSFVLNGNCAGQGFGYRTDQSAVIDYVLENSGDERDEIRIVSS